MLPSSSTGSSRESIILIPAEGGVTEPDQIAVQMRDALRRLAKAVVVITVRHDGQRYAMAATAVSELSMDPPSLLICVNPEMSKLVAAKSSVLFVPQSW